MILGSDRHDRNYGGVGPALGGHFARAGFASLVWDKPGVGRSSGDYNDQSLRDRADEALAAVRFLRGRDDIKRDMIGLWGHSQGGMVAPLAASLSPEIAFLIEVSGWQGAVWKQDPARVEAELRAAGFSNSDVADGVAFARKRMEMIRGTTPYEELERAQNQVKSSSWFCAVRFCDRARFYSARRSVGFDTSSWWPGVRCPVLVFYGDCDTSTGPPEPLVAIIRRGLKAAGNRDLTVRIVPGADHSLRRVPQSGRPLDATSANKRSPHSGLDFAPGYIETMTDWLVRIENKSSGH
jgi:pimeloyl-ACP methyl ester carboxylesterase